MASREFYIFGDFTLDVEKKELRDLTQSPPRGLVCGVRPQSLALLVYLIRNKDRAVEKSEAWKNIPKTTKKRDEGYDPNLVEQALTSLRHTLGDDGTTYISSDTRNHLRFICPLTEPNADNPPLETGEPPVVSKPIQPPAGPPPAQEDPMPEPVTRSWRGAIGIRNVLSFVRDFTALVRHPIKFAQAVSQEAQPRSGGAFSFFWVAICVTVPFYWLSFLHSPDLQFPYSLRFVVATIIGFPFAALFLTLVWKLIGRARPRHIFGLCIYFLSVQLLGGVVAMGLGSVFLTRSASNAGPAPFQYESGIGMAEKMGEELYGCSIDNSVSSCIASTQPIGLSKAAAWSRAVLKEPGFWFGVAIVLLGIFFSFVYNISLCRACASIAQPRWRFLTWCVVPFAFMIPGALSNGVGFASRELTHSLIGPQNCQIRVPSSPTLNPAPVVYADAAICADFPLIDAGFATSRDWSLSEAAHREGLSANLGETIAVRLYLENGASEALDLREMTARNVWVRVSILHPKPNILMLRAEAYGANAPMISSFDTAHGGDVTITTNAPVDAALVPEMACIQRKSETKDVCNTSAGDVVLRGSFLQGWFRVGDIVPGYRNGVHIRFQFRLKATPNGLIPITP